MKLNCGCRSSILAHQRHAPATLCPFLGGHTSIAGSQVSQTASSRDFVTIWATIRSPTSLDGANLATEKWSR